MKILSTLLLAFALPALLLPAGTTICVCDLVGGRHAMESCGTCHMTCCGHPQRGGDRSTVESVVSRDCFLRVPASDPADGPVAKQTMSHHDDATQVPLFTSAVFSFDADHTSAEPGIRELSRTANPRATAIPLFARALPLRL